MPEAQVPPKLVTSEVLREWIGSAKQIIVDNYGYRDLAIRKLQKTFDEGQREKALLPRELVMLDLPRPLKGTSASLTPSFCGPYEI